MKKFIGTIILLFLIYYVYQFMIIYFQGGHNITYTMSYDKYDFEINEILSTGENDKDNYSLKINVDNTEFNILTFHNFVRASKIVTNLRYIKDDTYSCIYLTYRDEDVKNDILCKKDDIQLYYHSISNPSDELKSFAKSLKDLGYSESTWNNNLTNAKSINDYSSYVDNMLENHFVSFYSDNAIYRINTIDNVVKVTTLISNYYSNAKLYTFINNNFIYYDYINKDFARFLIKNINNKGENLIAFDDINLSFDSYFLGKHNNSLYIYDPDAKKEYELDMDMQNLLEVGNKETGILYYDGGKAKRTSIDNVKQNMFGGEYENDYTNKEYSKIVKIGNDYGYYYLYKKVSSGYEIYRCSINDKEDLTYLFNISSLENIIYLNEYIYYVENNTINYYSDYTGVKTIFKANNNFNSDMIFTSYIS